MNKDDIPRMVREAEDRVIANPDLDWKREFAHLVAAAEREACAKLVEDWDSDSADPRDVADAIRARGQA